jgi:hypothetical protein
MAGTRLHEDSGKSRFDFAQWGQLCMVIAKFRGGGKFA